MRILIAEDDSSLASFVKKGLDAEHYAVDVSSDGEQARAMAGEFDYDLVVLDLSLPRLDGVAILRYLRTRKPSMPIIVLTGRTRVEDRVECLDLGADDYLGKPFSFSELSARIRALLRRCHLPAESVLTVDDLKLDRVERKVERAGRRIDLTGKEFALLEYLMRNAGRRITRAMIIEHVWNLSFDTCTNVVDVYVNYDHSKHVQFGSYAKFRIRGAIMDSLREMDWSPRDLRRKARRLEEANNSLRSALGRNPSETELAAELGIDLHGLQMLLGEIDGLEVGSLRVQSPRDGKEEDLCEYLPDDPEKTPLLLCLRSEMKDLLTRAIEELPEKERQVLALYYYEELTMKEVGAVLGVGESRVSQIHSMAVVRLRARLAELTAVRAQPECAAGAVSGA
jgi:FliA/WhiG family RNA polymerase sigma factor